MAGGYGPPKDHSAISKPRFGGRPHPQTAILKPEYPWQKWDDLSVRLFDVPTWVTTYDLWRIFSKQGEVSFIEIFDGQRRGSAKIRFSPPPNSPFWSYGTYVISSEDAPPTRNAIARIFLEDHQKREGPLKIQSPIKKWKFYQARMKLKASAIHFGLMIDPNSMMPLYSIMPGPNTQYDTSLFVDLVRNRIVANFTAEFHDSQHPTDFDRANKYMFNLPFSQLTTIRRIELSTQAFALIISVDSPPQYFRKRQNPTTGHSDEILLWNEWDTWYRQTDIVYDPYRLQREIITLHKDQPVIDIGKPVRRIVELLLINQVAGEPTFSNLNIRGTLPPSMTILSKLSKISTLKLLPLSPFAKSNLAQLSSGR